MEMINVLSLQNIGHATGMVGMACVVYAYFAVERDWFNNKDVKLSPLRHRKGLVFRAQAVRLSSHTAPFPTIVI